MNIKLNLIGFILFLIFILILHSTEVYSKVGPDNQGAIPAVQTGSGDNTATGDGGTTSPSDFPSEPTLTANSQIHIVGNAKIIDNQGLTTNGNAFTLESASSIYTGGFVFNDVGATSIVADGNKLISARVTSSKEDNRFVIKNPFDPYEIEKINIYLNNTQTMSYSFDSENVTITIPESSKAIIAKGSKNITIEPNGNTATIKIDNTKIIGAKGEVYDKPQYTISGANLTYQNKNIIERLITLGEAKVRIDTEKGFGYMLLNGQTNILPGDSYEYYNLTKKELSYSLYNQGQSAYEYGFLKAGFIYELLSTISPTAVNYGFEGNTEITLKGIIEYKRMQSYDQLKAIAGTYANYKAMNLPFLTVYKSEKPANEYKIKFQNTNYTATHTYEDNTIQVSTQNTGHHKVAIEKHSPIAYYYTYNLQDCPNYLTKSTATPTSGQINTDVKISKGTLTYRNWKVYSEGTDDYTRINDKLKQMIITSTPEKYGSVDLG